ncbi:MAG: hypothetical protein R2882_03665 [Gemmatimonadales bacterium]
MRTGALIFMLVGWTVVLSIMIWSFSKLLRSDPEHEKLPPPGTSL